MKSRRCPCNPIVMLSAAAGSRGESAAESKHPYLKFIVGVGIPPFAREDTPRSHKLSATKCRAYQTTKKGRLPRRAGLKVQPVARSLEIKPQRELSHAVTTGIPVG